MTKAVTSIFKGISDLRWEGPRTGKPDWLLMRRGDAVTADFNSMAEAFSFLEGLNLAKMLQPTFSIYIQHTAIGENEKKFVEVIQNVADSAQHIHVMPYGAERDLEDKIQHDYNLLSRPCVLSIPVTRINLKNLNQSVAAQKKFLQPDPENTAIPALEAALS